MGRFGSLLVKGLVVLVMFMCELPVLISFLTWFFLFGKKIENEKNRYLLFFFNLIKYAFAIVIIKLLLLLYK